MLGRSPYNILMTVRLPKTRKVSLMTLFFTPFTLRPTDTGKRKPKETGKEKADEFVSFKLNFI